MRRADASRALCRTIANRRGGIWRGGGRSRLWGRVRGVVVRVRSGTCSQGRRPPSTEINRIVGTGSRPGRTPGTTRPIFGSLLPYPGSRFPLREGGNREPGGGGWFPVRSGTSGNQGEPPYDSPCGSGTNRMSAINPSTTSGAMLAMISPVGTSRTMIPPLSHRVMRSPSMARPDEA